MNLVRNSRRSTGHSTFVATLTIIMIVIFASYLAALFTFTIPDTARDMVNQAGGWLFANVSTCIAFWVSDTRGSQRKDSLLADSVPVQRGRENEQ